MVKVVVVRGGAYYVVYCWLLRGGVGWFVDALGVVGDEDGML